MVSTQTWYVFLVMPESLTNAEIARRLKEIRTLMEFAGESFFKFMAYERAAETIENAAPLGDVLAGGRLQELPGVGKTIAARIAELCQTGTCGYLEELRARYPSTLLEVLEVGGVGMKTAQQLFERLGVASLADLQRALDAGSLSEIPRLGKKSIENIRRGVLAFQGRSKRTPLGIARPLALEIAAFLAASAPAHDLTPAGSVRRQEPTVGDIDIVCTSDDPDAVIAAFTGWERPRRSWPRAAPKPASGSPADCKSTCACCRRTSTATSCSTSRAVASTTSSCARWRCARTCGSAKTASSTSPTAG